MAWQNTQNSYGDMTKFLHWLIAILVICMLFLGYFMAEIKNKELFSQVINVHKLVGLSILFLMVIRMFWTLSNPKPKSLIVTPAWQRFTEKFVHFLLYAVLIAMPIAGWIMSVAAGHAPKLFHWLINLPIEKSKAVSGIAMDVHNTLAVVIIVLVSIHILAAFYHYLFKKDNVLQRMLPGKTL